MKSSKIFGILSVLSLMSTAAFALEVGPIANPTCPMQFTGSQVPASVPSNNSSVTAVQINTPTATSATGDVAPAPAPAKKRF